MLLAVATACVPKGRHELLEVQLDATRIALSARAVQCQQDVHQLEDQLEDLTYEIVLRQLQLDELGSLSGLQDAEIVQLHGQAVALAAEIDRLTAENAQLQQALEAARPRRRSKAEAEVEAPPPPHRGSDRAGGSQIRADGPLP